MKNWISSVKNFFERKANNIPSNNKNESSSVTGIVKERMKYFEELQAMNNERPATDTTDGFFKKCKGSYDFPQTASTKSKNGLELTPSMVKNSDNICIYQDGDDAIYGSFKKRPKFSNTAESTENEVRMRLKVQENEHLEVRRYQSMLKTPLSQQLIMSKYNETSIPSGSGRSNDVTSIIDKWNQEGKSNRNQEKLIDIDLLNSICKNKTIDSYPEKRKSSMQLLDGNRPLRWVNTDRVISANIVKTMTREEINFQESQFELIASEASYYKSLNVLIDKFYNSPLLSVNSKENGTDRISHIKPYQKEHLFSNILQIHSISGKFLADLEKKFSESIVMKDVCCIVTKYAKNQFKVYVPYLQNQKFQTDAYNKLKEDEEIYKIIVELENQPECCCLSLDSFLILPMQRLFRIQLLLKAIKKNVPNGYTLSGDSVDIAIFAVEEVINQCNAQKGQMDERERMISIISSLTAKPGATIPALSSGTLLHEGAVRCYRKTSGMRSIRMPVYDAWIILTNEYFLITKITKTKKMSYVIECISSIEDMTVDAMLSEESKVKDDARQFSVTFNKTCTYILQTKSSADYDTWIQTLSICPKRKLINSQ